MLVLMMTSKVLSSLESSAAPQLGTKERSVLALLVRLFDMTSQLFFGPESKLAQLADEATAVLPNVHGVLAEALEDEIALETGRFKIVELHVVALFEVHAEVLSRSELSVTAVRDAFVLVAV